jgi:hypothetical protein
MRRVECFGVELESPLLGSTGLPDASGAITIPAGPGLGCDPDPEVLARFRQT